MRLRLISCQVFCREAAAVIARSPHTVEVEFLPISLHSIGCERMRERLQGAIDRKSSGYDAILLAYGLCSHGLDGLRARAGPLVVARAHDCLTLLLGSKERYRDYFDAHPGTYFHSSGWMEHRRVPAELAPLSIAHQHSLDASFEELSARFGPENAHYLDQALRASIQSYRRLAFISMGVEPDDRLEQRSRREAAQQGWRFEKLSGDLSLLQRLVNGDWSPAEFLVVQPGQAVAASFDETIVKAVSS